MKAVKCACCGGSMKRNGKTCFRYAKSERIAE